MFFYSVGAFKTLDKDNSGSIDLDIKEVNHSYLSLASPLLLAAKRCGKLNFFLFSKCFRALTEVNMLWGMLNTCQKC